MITRTKIAKSKNTTTTRASLTKGVIGKKPSWRKLVRKLKSKSEPDGEFQDGDYNDDCDLPEYDFTAEED